MMTFLLPLLWVALSYASGGEHGGGEHGGLPLKEMALHAMNLAILIAIIVKFGGRAIKDSLANRATTIKDQLEKSQALHQAATERVAKLEAQLAGFDQQLVNMKAEAEIEAARERDEILARGARDARQIAEGAERTIQGELTKARQQLRAEAVTLAIRVAEGQLRASLRPEDEERFAADFLKSASEVAHG